jgi:hypothetical protein
MKNHQVHIRLRTRLLPALAGLAAFMQIIDPYPVWTILLVALGGAWLLGYLWMRALARSLTLRREMRFGWAQVGDRLEERFTLRNDGWLPALWIEIHDESDLPGYEISRVTALWAKNASSGAPMAFAANGESSPSAQPAWKPATLLESTTWCCPIYPQQP